MKSYHDMRHSPEMFLRDLQANVDEAHAALVAVCAQSSDPKVTAHHARWLALSEFASYLANPRKAESSG